MLAGRQFSRINSGKKSVQICGICEKPVFVITPNLLIPPLPPFYHRINQYPRRKRNPDIPEFVDF